MLVGFHLANDPLQFVGQKHNRGRALRKKLVKSALFDCDRRRSVSAAGINAGINRDKIESARCGGVGYEAAGVARGG